MKDVIIGMLRFLIVIVFAIGFSLLMSKLIAVEEKIDTANEMLVQIRTSGIIGERVK